MAEKLTQRGAVAGMRLQQSGQINGLREREEGEEHAYRVLQVAHSFKITLRAIGTFPHRLISNVRSVLYFA